VAIRWGGESSTTLNWSAYFYLGQLPNTSAKLGAANNQIGEINDFGKAPPSNTVGFNLIGPNRMIVQQDLWKYCQNCTTAIERRVTYKVLNSDSSVAANRPIGEVVNLGSSTCTQGRPADRMNSCTVAKGSSIPNPSGGTANLSEGMWATDSYGQFTDAWSIGSDFYGTPAGCGFGVIYDHWQLCGVGLDSELFGEYMGLTFATPKGYIHNNAVGITVGTTTYVLPTNKTTCPANTPNCANSIPVGTVIH